LTTGLYNMGGYICVALVGVVFLGTGAIKALDAREFVRQLSDYRLLGRAWVRPAALAFIGFEWVAGVGLLLALSDILFPVLAVSLAGLACLTVWGTSTGRVEDCGCYGGFLRLRPWQSVALDAAYIALLAVAWIARGDAIQPWATPAGWKLAASLGAGAAGMVLGRRSLKTGALVDFSPLKPGKRWNPRWLDSTAPSLASGNHFIVFLSKECPYCKRWVPLLNVVHVEDGTPNVLGILWLHGDAQKEFLAQHMIHFPIAYMRKELMTIMADAYPTAALVEDGVIRQRWVGEMPKAYLERIRSFLNAISTGPIDKPSFSG
jgi:hypothetical protein